MIAWIGLGSNLGDRTVNLTRAAEALSTLPGTSLLAASGIYRSTPVGKGYKGDFYNAVIGLRTTLPAKELHLACIKMEGSLGRDRSRADRTIDIDILLYGDEVIDSGELTVPHPRMAQRRFVLEPFAEIAPEVVHPLECISIAELYDHLGDRQPLERLLQPLFPVAGC